MSFFSFIISFLTGEKTVSETNQVSNSNFVAENPHYVPPPISEIWPPADPATVIACTAWMEDVSGHKDGMQAVTNVIVNRARSGIVWWGTNLRDVCLAHEQFSSWNAGSVLLPKVKAAMKNADPNFTIAKNLAELAVKGILPDLTRNSDSYFALGIVPPAWAEEDRFTLEIGGQRFYRLYLNAPGIVAGPEA